MLILVWLAGERMDAFSYLSIVPSIIIALGLTRLLTGIGRLLENRGQMRIYWVHLVWGLNVFLFMVLNWWVLFRWDAQQEWNFFLFLFLLLTPTISFLLSVILFPDPFRDKMNFKENFYDDNRWFFALASLLPPLDFFDTLLKGYPHLIAQGPIYIVTIVLITILSIIAAITKNQKYHMFFSVFFLVYISFFISVNLNTFA
jgi:hypothetical protein